MKVKAVSSDVIDESINFITIALAVGNLSGEDKKAYSNNLSILKEIKAYREYFKEDESRFKRMKKHMTGELDIDASY